MKRRALLPPLLLLAVAACSTPAPTTGSRPAATGFPAVSPTPVGAARTLVVALESSTSSPLSPDTIAIAGLDGYAVAKARFKPHARPWVGPDLGPELPEVAHLAAGRAYYVDGDGVVRSLGVDGQVREETRFPVTGPQQEVSFAVSPDGHSLVGAVLTLPAEPSPPPTPGYYMPTDAYSMDVLTATSGSAATVAYHRTWTRNDQLGSGAQFVGWDPAGPVATWPSILGTQGGSPHQWNGTALIHFPGGRPGSAVPAPDRCIPMDLLPTGVFVCSPGNGPFQVLGPDGRVRWRSPESDPAQGVIYAFLAPDGLRVVGLGRGPASVVYAPTGSPVALPSLFVHAGWIDDTMVAGSLMSPSGEGDLAYVSLAKPGEAVDLGFKGEFVGSLKG